MAKSNQPLINSLPGPIRVPLKGFITLTSLALFLAITVGIIWCIYIGGGWVLAQLNWTIVSWICGIIVTYIVLGFLGATWQDEKY